MFGNCMNSSDSTFVCRAYVVRVPSAQGEATIANRAFAEDVKKWMESKVASHKLLRGGELYPLPRKLHLLIDP